MKANVGIAEIAKLANVSVGTVDRALHNRGRVSEATRKRVLTIAAKFGYTPNLAARALKTGPRSHVISVCFPKEIHYFFDELRSGIKEEAKRFEHLGLQVQFVPLERLGDNEFATIKDLIKEVPRALIITPGIPDQLTALIDKAEEKNIRVICLDSDSPSSHRTAMVCADSTACGQLAAELLGRFVPSRSQVAVVTGTMETQDHQARVKSFRDLFSQVCSGGKVVGIIEDHEREEESFQKCYRLLQENPKIAGLYVSTANCLPVCRAISTLNLTHKVQLLTSDLFPEMVPYFDMGIIAASIHGRPFALGRVAIQLLAELLLYGRAVQSKNYLAPHVVMKSTLHLFREIRKNRENFELTDSVD